MSLFAESREFMGGSCDASSDQDDWMPRVLGTTREELLNKVGSYPDPTVDSNTAKHAYENGESDTNDELSLTPEESKTVYLEEFRRRQNKHYGKIPVKNFVSSPEEPLYND